MYSLVRRIKIYEQIYRETLYTKDDLSISLALSFHIKEGLILHNFPEFYAVMYNDNAKEHIKAIIEYSYKKLRLAQYIEVKDRMLKVKKESINFFFPNWDEIGGLCFNIYMTTQLSIDIFPELLKRKPKNIYGSYWFKKNRKGFEKRIQLLDECIKELADELEISIKNLNVYSLRS